jgi:hypothetical protein
MLARDAAEVQPSKLGAALAQILREEGYLPRIDEDGDISFKAEGIGYLVRVAVDDDEYCQLQLGYRLPEDTLSEHALSVANHLNGKLKAVKTTVWPWRDARQYSSVSFTIEQFFDEPERLRAPLGRSISALRNASDEYFEQLGTHGEGHRL